MSERDQKVFKTKKLSRRFYALLSSGTVSSQLLNFEVNFYDSQDPNAIVCSESNTPFRIKNESFLSSPGSTFWCMGSFCRCHLMGSQLSHAFSMHVRWCSVSYQKDVLNGKAMPLTSTRLSGTEVNQLFPLIQEKANMHVPYINPDI